MDGLLDRVSSKTPQQIHDGCDHKLSLGGLIDSQILGK